MTLGCHVNLAGLWHTMSGSCDGDSSGDMNVAIDFQASSSVDNSMNVSTDVEGSSSVRDDRSIRRSFHQGDDRFEFGGVQCMATALFRMAKQSRECFVI